MGQLSQRGPDRAAGVAARASARQAAVAGSSRNGSAQRSGVGAGIGKAAGPPRWPPAAGQGQSRRGPFTARRTGTGSPIGGQPLRLGSRGGVVSLTAAGGVTDRAAMVSQPGASKPPSRPWKPRSQRRQRRARRAHRWPLPAAGRRRGRGGREPWMGCNFRSFPRACKPQIRGKPGPAARARSATHRRGPRSGSWAGPADTATPQQGRGGSPPPRGPQARRSAAAAPQGPGRRVPR